MHFPRRLTDFSFLEKKSQFQGFKGGGWDKGEDSFCDGECPSLYQKREREGWFQP